MSPGERTSMIHTLILYSLSRRLDSFISFYSFRFHSCTHNRKRIINPDQTQFSSLELHSELINFTVWSIIAEEILNFCNYTKQVIAPLICPHKFDFFRRGPEHENSPLSTQFSTFLTPKRHFFQIERIFWNDVTLWVAIFSRYQPQNC